MNAAINCMHMLRLIAKLFKHASNWNQTTGTANMLIPLATVFMGEIYKLART